MTCMIDDLMDEPEYDEGSEREPITCFCCHHETAGESCGFCGNDLCPDCFGMGGGFCNGPHTQEQIDAYEDEMYPPANEDEREQRERQRKARKELQEVGILPKPQ